MTYIVIILIWDEYILVSVLIQATPIINIYPSLVKPRTTFNLLQDTKSIYDVIIHIHNYLPGEPRFPYKFQFKSNYSNKTMMKFEINP
jgi:hypothetical protein